MKELQLQKSLPSANGSPSISLVPPKNSSFRFLAVFLICFAILAAAFSVSAVLIKGSDGGFLPFVKENTTQEQKEESSTEDRVEEKFPEHDEKIPEGAVSIVSKDLSYTELGESYFHNETPYTPVFSELLERDLLSLREGKEPQVLILHTHTSESYLEEGKSFLEGAPGDVTYSRDEGQNILAVGKVLA